MTGSANGVVLFDLENVQKYDKILKRTTQVRLFFKVTGCYLEKSLTFVNQIEKLNLIANPENRKRPGTPINKRGAHIVTLFFDI